MNSYNYKDRKGVRKVSWEEIRDLCKKLAEQISEMGFDLIIGVAKDGLFPAALIAGMLRKEIYPIRLSRRENDEVKYDKPTWRVDIPDISGKTALIIDDISSTGESLEIVKERATEKGASAVKTLVLVAHKIEYYKPDFYGLASDELVIFPWHEQILVNGKWQLHPELQEVFESLNKE